MRIYLAAVRSTALPPAHPIHSDQTRRDEANEDHEEEMDRPFTAKPRTSCSVTGGKTRAIRVIRKSFPSILFFVPFAFFAPSC
jgi:hypothetical protein